MSNHDDCLRVGQVDAQRCTGKQPVKQAYLLEPDDVGVQQGPMVDEFSFDILVNLHCKTQRVMLLLGTASSKCKPSSRELLQTLQTGYLHSSQQCRSPLHRDTTSTQNHTSGLVLQHRVSRIWKSRRTSKVPQGLCTFEEQSRASPERSRPFRHAR